MEYIWAVIKGKLYIEPRGNRTHVDWFEQKGWDTTGWDVIGGKYDRILRGLVDVGDNSLWWENHKGGDTPNYIHTAFIHKYPKYKNYDTIRNPGMYSKLAVKSYAQGRERKSGYKRNIVPFGSVGASAAMTAVEEGVKEIWRKGKKSK